MEPRAKRLAGADDGSVIRKAIMIGNYTPRVCGIATFTRDLLAGLVSADSNIAWGLVAMNDREPSSYNFGPEVTDVIQQDCEADYLRVADAINSDSVDVVFVQHEFGIFGGPAGAFLLSLLRRVRAPIVVTLHTVLSSPNEDQRRVMTEIIDLGKSVVVMAHTGADMLKRIYGAPAEKVCVIPHGAPSRPSMPSELFKARFGLSGRQTLMTFGLLSPNKGIETIIKALPRILQSAPDATYVIAGATHPNLVRQCGEAYREGLEKLASGLGVSGAVRFINRFMTDTELVDLLQATDVYVTPYLTEAQITSGTLSYAIALGRPTVSTPYWHAVEALACGAGVICPFGDVEAFGREIAGLLTDNKRRERMGSIALKAGRASKWWNVGAAYLRTASNALQAKAQRHGARSEMAVNLL